jgi:hypothetical protein
MLTNRNFGRSVLGATAGLVILFSTFGSTIIAAGGSPWDTPEQTQQVQADDGSPWDGVKPNPV